MAKTYYFLANGKKRASFFYETLMGAYEEAGQDPKKYFGKNKKVGVYSTDNPKSAPRDGRMDPSCQFVDEIYPEDFYLKVSDFEDYFPDNVTFIDPYPGEILGDGEIFEN